MTLEGTQSCLGVGLPGNKKWHKSQALAVFLLFLSQTTVVEGPLSRHNAALTPVLTSVAASARVPLVGLGSRAGGQLEGQCPGRGSWCCTGAEGVVPGWPEAVSLR